MFNLLLSVIFCFSILCVDIGSDTAVTRFNAQQALLNGDRIAGFASLDGGFSLNGLITTAIWDSFFPVSGGVDWNGGTLILNRDLVMHNVSSFGPYGAIAGNGHALWLPCLDKLPSLPLSFFRCLTFLVNQTPAENNIFTIDWNFNDTLLAVGLAAGGGPGGENLYVYSWDGTNLTESAALQVQGVSPDINDIKWHPDKNILALVRDATGADEIVTVSYDATGPSLVVIDGDTVPANAMGVGWTTAGDFLAVGSEDTAGQLRIYSVDDIGNITLEITQGLGTTQVASEETTDFNEDDRYVALGVNANGVDPTFYIYTFDKTVPSLTLNVAETFTPNETVEAFAWSRTNTDTFAVGFDGSDVVQVYDHEPFTPSGGDPGSIVLIATSEAFDDKPEAISFSPVEEGCLVAGADGPAGSGTVRTFFFDRTAGTIETISDFTFQDDCETARWSSTGRYLAAGSDFGDELLVFEAVVIPTGDGNDVGPSRCFIWSDLDVYMTCNLTLTDFCCTFTGISTWHGRGHCLTFDTTTTFRIAPDASLCFSDVMIKGMNDQRINCLDNTATLSLKNVEFYMDHHFTFTMGQLDIIDNVLLTGEGKQFIYQSSKGGKVFAASCIIVDNNTTLRYAPLVSDQTLFEFVDFSSKILLKSSTLSSSDVGWQLTRGSLYVDGQSFLFNEGTSSSQALIFGDGITTANNFCVKWLPGANLDLLQGHARVNNV